MGFYMESITTREDRGHGITIVRTRILDKDGRPLHGLAQTSFIKDANTAYEFHRDSYFEKPERSGGGDEG